MTLFLAKLYFIYILLPGFFANHPADVATQPVCRSGIALELQPLVPPADVDGDDITENGAVSVFAMDLLQIESPADTAGFTFSVNREGDPADPERDSLILTCNDPASLTLEVWRWSEDGSGEFCTTFVLLQDNFIVDCRNPLDPIVGIIATESLEGVADVTVTELADGAVVKTREDGLYTFNQWDHPDFVLAPQLDTLPLNGVTTFDLVLTSKHILGLQELDSPYRLIAADVNRSGSITVMDLIELRRLILHIDDRFQNNTSWRFVPALHQFADPADPWLEGIPEVVIVNDGNTGGLVLDFIAIKIGDVSGDAETGGE